MPSGNRRPKWPRSASSATHGGNSGTRFASSRCGPANATTASKSSSGPISTTTVQAFVHQRLDGRRRGHRLRVRRGRARSRACDRRGFRCRRLGESARSPAKTSASANHAVLFAEALRSRTISMRRFVRWTAPQLSSWRVPLATPRAYQHSRGASCAPGRRWTLRVPPKSSLRLLRLTPAPAQLNTRPPALGKGGGVRTSRRAPRLHRQHQRSDDAPPARNDRVPRGCEIQVQSAPSVNAEGTEEWDPGSEPEPTS